MQGLRILMQGPHLSGAVLISGDTNEVVGTITCGFRVPDHDESIFLITAGCVITWKKGDRHPPEPLETSLYEYETNNEEDIITPIKLGRVWGPRENADGSTQYDWAVIEIEKGEQWKALNFCEVVKMPDYNDSNQEAHIIRPQGLVRGTIKLGSRARLNPDGIQYWTVDHLGCLHIVEVGSPVIDPVTKRMYGYISFVLGSTTVMSLDGVLHEFLEMMEIPSNARVEVVTGITSSSDPVEAQGVFSQQFPKHLDQNWPPGNAQVAGKYFQQAWRMIKGG